MLESIAQASSLLHCCSRVSCTKQRTIQTTRIASCSGCKSGRLYLRSLVMMHVVRPLYRRSGPSYDPIRFIAYRDAWTVENLSIMTLGLKVTRFTYGSEILYFGLSTEVAWQLHYITLDMATNVLPPLSVSGNGVGSGQGRTHQQRPLPVPHPRAKQIMSERESIVAATILCAAFYHEYFRS